MSPLTSGAGRGRYPRSEARRARRAPLVLGVDFTSAPSPRKPIAVASGALSGETLLLYRIERLADFGAFEALLARPGPWIGGFDFPFGLPREALVDLGWPRRWAAMVAYCVALGRTRLRAAFDAYRRGRPAGCRYAHRATDGAARSHSPLKLVNPPVALMFLEGAPRLARAGLALPGLRRGDRRRIAVEAYPGLLARALIRGSYKSDERRKRTPERRRARAAIVHALVSGANPLGLRLCAPPPLLAEIVRDASGDALDAVIAALQAAWCLKRRRRNYGLPRTFDACEGWIATAPPRQKERT